MLVPSTSSKVLFSETLLDAVNSVFSFRAIPTEVIHEMEIQYNTVKPNLKEPVVLLRFRGSFGLEKAKIKKRKIANLIYLSVHPIDWV